MALTEDPCQHFQHAGWLALPQNSLAVDASRCDDSEVSAADGQYQADQILPERNGGSGGHAQCHDHWGGGREHADGGGQGTVGFAHDIEPDEHRQQYHHPDGQQQ